MQHVIQSVNWQKLLSSIHEDDFIIIDSKVKRLHFPNLNSEKLIEVSDPEREKNLKGYETIIFKILDLGVTRNSKILAIGGGALSDLVGFVAATTLRGIELKIIPTTLLSMIDAAIGGKSALNTPHGKNQIGAFHFPSEILLCMDFLKTLSTEDYQSGLGELSKYALLDKSIFELIKKEAIEDCILACAKFKENLVNEDPHEKGRRIILNLGHTLGHCFEIIETSAHGLAVAQGIEAILNLYKVDLLEDFEIIKKALNLKVTKPTGSFDELEALLKMDKKKKTNKSINLVIPKKIGEVEVVTYSFDTLMKDIKGNEYFKSFR